MAGRALNRPSMSMQRVLGPEGMAAATMLGLSKAIQVPISFEITHKGGPK